VFRSVARPLVAVAASALLGGIAFVAPPSVRAASDGLTIVTQTNYVALPAEKRVHVMVQAWATNTKPDSPDTRYYYTSARFGVPTAVQNLTAYSGSSFLGARVLSSSSEFSQIEIAFGVGVFHGVTYPFTFAFDMLDAGGVPNRNVRVAASLVAFPVWAFGSQATPGSTISVKIPAGYSVTVEAGDLKTSRGPNGETVLTATAITDPTTFYAYVTADRPGAFRETSVTVRLPEGPVTVFIRAWDDDPAWGTRVKGIVSKGLPVLEDLIGVGYQVHGKLKVDEAAVSRLGDYAGLYDPQTEAIQLRYDADGYTALHETAHSWFNYNLFSGRWPGEAWAEYYGVEAGKRIGTDGRAFVLTPQLSAVRFPLNAWADPGQEPTLREDFAYAASYRLARLIAARAGQAALRTVWLAAENNEGAYQPRARGTQPEKGTAKVAEGWQLLLDLLEERTGHSYVDLWRQWVVTSAQLPLLDERAKARADYAATLKAAGNWELPYDVRYSLGAWQFDYLSTELSDARSVLRDRDQIAAAAARLNLAVPGTLKADFETGTTFDKAKQDAASELTALTALQSSSDALARSPSALEWAGLLFANPGSQLGTARSAFENGDSDTATRDARAAQEQRERAADAGRLRVSVAGGAVLVLDGLAMGGLAVRRRRRRRTPVAPMGAGPQPSETEPAA
jgi:hypothetical protein